MVELISYTFVFILMNAYFVWRMVDDMWVDQTFQNDFEAEGADETQKALARTSQIVNVVFTVLCPVMTLLSVTIIPAVYEDIKDNIFLLLGGNRNLWDNFYNLTLTMSALKLDIIANLEFWTTFFFFAVHNRLQRCEVPCLGLLDCIWVAVVRGSFDRYSRL